MIKLFRRPAALALASAGLLSAPVAAMAQSAAASSPNAGLWDMLNPYLHQGASWIAGAAITIAAAQVTRYTGLQIRQTWVDKIHAGADTGISVVLDKTEGAIDKAKVVDGGVAWVRANMAPTLKKLGMTPGQLEGIVIKQLGQAAIGALALGGAPVESPAMARAAGSSAR